MRVGLIVGLHGSTGSAPGWPQVRDQVRTAEAVGFDVAVIADALLYRSATGPSTGYWESVSLAGAMSAVTSRIEIGHSVLNAPYRSAALTAKIAETLDEISGGRFFLGIGLGNTPDYEAFGVQADHRYGRFAESIEIIHSLLRTGEAEVDGTYQFARGAELVPRGPRPDGVPIVIAAHGPRMLRLAARYADGWNWWTSWPPDLPALGRLVADLDRACDENGRDPVTLARSVDVYSLDPIGRFAGAEAPIRGEPEEVADQLLRFGELGFGEVRVNVFPVDALGALPEAIEALAPVVELLHAE